MGRSMASILLQRWRSRGQLAGFLALMLIPAVLPAADKPQPIPVADYLRPWTINAPSLSPNGRYLAAINRDADGRRNLVVSDLETGKLTALRAKRSFGFDRVEWFDDEHLALFGSYTDNGVEALFVVDRDPLRDPQPLVSGREVSFVGHPRARPGHLVVSHRAVTDSRIERLFEVDSGNPLRETHPLGQAREFFPARSFALPDEANIWSYWSDPSGEPTLLIGLLRGENVVYHYDPATEASTRVHLDPDFTRIRLVENGARKIWAAQTIDGVAQLSRYDVETASWEEPLLTDDTYSLDHAHLFYSRRAARVVGVSYHRDRPTQRWFDDDYALAHTAVHQQRPQRVNLLLETDEAERRFLFRSESATEPGEFMLVDLDKRSVEVVAQRAPHLADFPGAQTQPVRFPAADGLTLEGYLTLPLGSSRENPPPLIVIADDSHATWRYGPFVQLLASRGYAVLQPNHRAVSAYLIPDRITERWNFDQSVADIIAATRGIARTGIIDPQRIAVLGEKTGGFLAMGASVTAPELFRCTHSSFAIFDFDRAVRRFRVFHPRLYRYYRSRLDQAGFDEATAVPALKPLDFADRITGSVFLADQKRTRSHSNEEISKLRQILEHNQTPVEVFLGETNSSGSFALPDQKAYTEALLAFLEKNLAK